MQAQRELFVWESNRSANTSYFLCIRFRRGVRAFFVSLQCSNFWAFAFFVSPNRFPWRFLVDVFLPDVFLSFYFRVESGVKSSWHSMNNFLPQKQSYYDSRNALGKYFNLIKRQRRKTCCLMKSPRNKLKFGAAFRSCCVLAPFRIALKVLRCARYTTIYGFQCFNDVNDI